MKDAIVVLVNDDVQDVYLVPHKDLVAGMLTLLRENVAARTSHLNEGVRFDADKTRVRIQQARICEMEDMVQVADDIVDKLA